MLCRDGRSTRQVCVERIRQESEGAELCDLICLSQQTRRPMGPATYTRKTCSTSTRPWTCAMRDAQHHCVTWHRKSWSSAGTRWLRRGGGSVGRKDGWWLDEACVGRPPGPAVTPRGGFWKTPFWPRGSRAKPSEVRGWGREKEATASSAAGRRAPGLRPGLRLGQSSPPAESGQPGKKDNTGGWELGWGSGVRQPGGHWRGLKFLFSFPFFFFLTPEKGFSPKTTSSLLSSLYKCFGEGFGRQICHHKTGHKAVMTWERLSWDCVSVCVCVCVKAMYGNVWECGCFYFTVSIFSLHSTF